MLYPASTISTGFISRQLSTAFTQSSIVLASGASNSGMAYNTGFPAVAMRTFWSNGLPIGWAITGDPRPDPANLGLPPSLSLSPGILLEIVENQSVVNNAVSGFGGTNVQICHALVRTTVVPEPTSLLCLLGFGFVGLSRRRRLL